MKRFAFWCACRQVLLCFVSLGLVQNSHAVSFQTLGHLPFGSISQANPVSADGSVVVGWHGTDRSRRAFRWTQETGMVDMGFYGSANAISADGSVIVGSLYPVGGDPFSDEFAFRWIEATGAVDLGDYPPPQDSFRKSGAISVSGDGSVVVGLNRSSAFRWTQDTGMIRISPPIFGRATGANYDGSVIVGRDRFGGSLFRWTAADGPVPLPLPPNHFCNECDSPLITPDGSIVVGYGVQVGSLPRRSLFRWNEATGLELFPSPSFVPRAVSADGRVIVGGREGAFYWTEAHGTRDLQQILVRNGVLDPSDGWDLRMASGVSADGRTIVGWAQHSGRSEAWIAHIPEPTSVALAVGLGLILVLRYRVPRSVRHVNN